MLKWRKQRNIKMMVNNFDSLAKINSGLELLNM